MKIDVSRHSAYCRFHLAAGYRINSDYALLIKSSDTKDKGEYFCRAQNSEGFGQDSRVFYVAIRGKNAVLPWIRDHSFLACATPDPIRFLLKPNSTYRVQEHDRLTLPCLVSGQPAPSIKWFKVRMFTA